jgi:predicted regulator of Ras-like GTPase activity (Roadblock/LC7/MglB family)
VTGSQQLVMYEDEYRQISQVITRLQKESNARVCYLVDKNGQLIADAGDTQDIDATSLASLTAGNIAATDGLAKLLGEKEFSIVFHEGEKDNIHISLVGQRVILVVIFDRRSSLGLVRLRVRRTSQELENIFESLLRKTQTATSAASPFAEITDADIDNLFQD